MPRQANILSFDEVKAREAGSPRVVSGSPARRRASSSESSNTASSQHRSARSLAKQASAQVVSSEKSSRSKPTARRSNSRAQANAGRASSRSRASEKATVRSSAGRRNHVEEAEQTTSRAAAKQDEGLLRGLQKRFRSAKADRAFEKTIGSQEKSANQTQGSRAALYEMKMGATHRKSSRMQDAGKSGKRSAGFALPLSLSAIQTLPSIAVRGLAVAFVAVFACFMLYPSCASYYNQMRELQQLQAEYEALETYNAEMQAQVDYLNTDEGLEDYARSELGWIRSDETMVTVEGVETTSTEEDTDDTLYLIAEGGVPAPDTWYSGVLDVVFGYGS